MEDRNIGFSKLIKRSLDYASLTFFPNEVGDGAASPTKLLSGLSETLEIPDTWHTVGKSNRGYAQVRINEGVDGVTAYCFPYAPNQFHMHLELKGAGCEAIGTERLGRIDSHCYDANLRFQASRLDFANDYVGFTPTDLQRTWHSGRTVSRIKRQSFMSNNDGTTFYCGSKESFQLCCYDKRGFTRAEFRVFGNDAKMFGSLVCDGGYAAAHATVLAIYGDKIAFNEADGSALAAWVALRESGYADSDRGARPTRVAPAVPALAKVLGLHETLRSLLGKVVILRTGLGISPELVTEMMDSMKVDAASMPEIEKIRKLVNALG